MLWRSGAYRSLLRMGIDLATLKFVVTFRTDQRSYLDFRREHAFLEARLNE